MSMLKSLPGWPHEQSPFHAAELALQERFGHRKLLDAAARRGVRGELIEQHREFYKQLPFILVGSVDGAGQPWASMLSARPGFVHSPDPSRLRFDAAPADGDPIREGLLIGAPVGVLGIEPSTRRRNRMSGRVTAIDDQGFTADVIQSYGNCPQYIQTRALHFLAPAEQPHQIIHADRLSAADRALLEQADTFYIASVNPNPADGLAGGADVSHRGGRPGFVRLDDDRTITTPDFVGNFMFNTLGNLMVEPRAGLLFADFGTGDLLFAAAKAEIIWDGPEVEAFAAAQRLVRFHLTRVIRLPGALPFRAEPDVGYASELAATGTWAEAARALAAQQAAGAWRPFRVTAIKNESETVRSFILEPADDGGVAPHRAGQFLPLRLPVRKDAPELVRTYTLSEVSDGRRYRISVKRQGEASRWLHEQAAIGTVLAALPPRGDFTFDEGSRRPVLFLSAGVGITPMVAMLNSVLVNDSRERHPAPILFLHGARNSREHPFAERLRDKARHHSNLRLVTAYSAPLPTDRFYDDFQILGRIDSSVLRQVVHDPDIDAYLCGPPDFMQAQYEALCDLGVPDRQIRAESFGPAGLRRSRRADGAETGTKVTFSKTGVTVNWRDDWRSLLAAAQAAHAPALYSCKSGVCGACAVRLLSGRVGYDLPPVAEREHDQVLICCAHPADGCDVELDL